MSSLSNGKVAYMEDPKMLLRLINEFSKDGGHKVNI